MSRRVKLLAWRFETIEIILSYWNVIIHNKMTDFTHKMMERDTLFGGNWWKSDGSLMENEGAGIFLFQRFILLMTCDSIICRQNSQRDNVLIQIFIHIEDNTKNYLSTGKEDSLGRRIIWTSNHPVLSTFPEYNCVL